VPQEPALSGPGPDHDPAGVPAGFPELGSPQWRLVPCRPDRDEAYLAALADDEDPGDLDEYEDPDCAPPPGLDDTGLAALIAEAREVTEDQARAAALMARAGTTGALAAADAVAMGRRGPGMPGSARSFPGEYSSRAAGFATGKPLDAAPGCAALGLFLDDAGGQDDRYPGATDDELLGVICAWDRVEAHMAARKNAAVAEFIRRRPARGFALQGQAQMPAAWDEFLTTELAPALGQCRGDAEDMLWLALDLQVKLPGTWAAFLAGILNQDKAEIIAAATHVLDPEEARAAEAMVLDRAGSLTPAGLRSAIARAVMEVAPDKARKRREEAAKTARVERWAEVSGNAALAGRELPPAEVLAADQRVTAWAKELKQAGLDGDMDQLRARAYLDILLGIDSRPAGREADGQSTDGRSPRGGGSGPSDPAEPRGPAPVGPLAGVIPPGFAGRVTLTTPLATLIRLADRPGELAGIGPIDPDLARDLAGAAARSPRSTWCVTVTDEHGHAIGHGCARPAPATSRPGRDKRDKPGSRGGHDPPWPPDPGRPAFSFTPAGQTGPPGGYGTWRFSTGIPGQRDLIIALGPLPTGECDHRHQANGHDPGVMLRHLAQVRHATCTGPACRTPAARCDFEHNIPYEAGGRTCLCNANPKCRHDHRLKQDPRWKAEQLPSGHVRWTTPSGRQYTTEPTRYPI
jgi:hypothetical protein